MDINGSEGTTMDINRSDSTGNNQDLADLQSFLEFSSEEHSNTMYQQPQQFTQQDHSGNNMHLSHDNFTQLFTSVLDRDNLQQHHHYHQHQQRHNQQRQELERFHRASLPALDLDMHSVSPNDVFRSPMVGPSPSTTATTTGSMLEAFTPLMSPAVTPIDQNKFSGMTIPPEFSMPGSYFSPTSSPMLEATNNNSHHTRWPSNNNNNNNGSRWRAPAVIAATNSPRVVKRSPMLKPSSNTNKRKSIIRIQPAINSNESASGSTSSENSVSPEALPEIAMPPPRNVALFASASNQSGTPATPASLMNLSPEQQQLQQQQSNDERLQNAIRATTTIASKPTRRSRSSTSLSSSSPYLGGSAPIKPKPIQPVISGRSSVGPSPVIKPKPSPHISPQLHPVGNGDLSSLLASKSNYQNIVEGNHSQLGLSYPEHLSAGLMSKKTNHKLAEQGRRNRMNVALSSLAELISTDGGSNSKASTVENAIKFIRTLQTELEDTRDKLKAYEPGVKEEDT